MFLGPLCRQVSLNVFFGKPGPWFEDCELDGDKNSIFHDVDGSVTGYKDAYVGRMDNYLIRHPNCVNVTKWNAVVCSGTYAQVGWACSSWQRCLWGKDGDCRVTAAPKHSIYKGGEESKQPWRRKEERFTTGSPKTVKEASQQWR